MCGLWVVQVILQREEEENKEESWTGNTWYQSSMSSTVLMKVMTSIPHTHAGPSKMLKRGPASRGEGMLRGNVDSQTRISTHNPVKEERGGGERRILQLPLLPLGVVHTHPEPVLNNPGVGAPNPPLIKVKVKAKVKSRGFFLLLPE